MNFQIVPPDENRSYESYGLLPSRKDHKLLWEVGQKILMDYVAVDDTVEHTRGEKALLGYFAQTSVSSMPGQYLVHSDQVYGIAAVLASDIIDSFPLQEREQALDISQFMIDSIQKYGGQ